MNQTKHEMMIMCLSFYLHYINFYLESEVKKRGKERKRESGKSAEEKKCKTTDQLFPIK